MFSQQQRLGIVLHHHSNMYLMNYLFYFTINILSLLPVIALCHFISYPITWLLSLFLLLLLLLTDIATNKHSAPRNPIINHTVLFYCWKKKKTITHEVWLVKNPLWSSKGTQDVARDHTLNRVH